MATTIKLKNGSGAPLAGDLVQGEPALDLTNKRLYTEDSGGTVIEIGTSPSTIDINAGTIDGTVIGGSSAAAGTFTTFTSTGIDDNATSTAITIDASENVGIGTNTPQRILDISSATSANIVLERTGATTSALVFNAASGETQIISRSSNSVDGSVPLAFQTGGSTRLKIDGSGNVGIGTTSPETLLMIEQAGTYTGVHNTAGLKIRNAAATTGVDNPYGAISLSKGTGSAGIAAIGDHATDADIVGLGFFVHASATGTDAATRAMTIDSSGNVGIGTTSPSSKLHVTGDASNYGILAEQLSGYGGLNIKSTTVNQTWSFIANDNSGNSDLLLYGGSSAGTKLTIDSSGNVGIGTASPNRLLCVEETSGGCVARFTSSPTDTTTIQLGNTGDENEGQIQYDNSNNFMSFTANAAERMRIDSSGNLLVGTTSAISSGRLSVLHNNTSGGQAASFNCTQYAGTLVRFEGGSGFCGSISYSGTTTTYNTSSDVRLKENIVDAPAGNIDAIRVRSFDWKADGSHQTYGMVAQELVDVAPEAVTQGKTEDDMWAVDYSKLVPMMIKEIQDLKAEVAALKGA